MARIRSIKPEFWTSEQIVECSTNARLLFIGIWNFADDAGRIPASAKSLKFQIFPGDDISSESIRGLLDELSTNDLVVRYEVEGKEFLQVTGWRHQKIDRPQPPKYPPPPKNQCEHSTNVRRALATEGIGEEGIGKEGIRKKDAAPQEHSTNVRRTLDEAAPSGAHLSLFEAEASGPADAETELFRRGREVLGKSAGGLVAQLLKAKDGKVALARAAIEQASLKESPREYIGAIIRGPLDGEEKPRVII
jgi:hypothetical protein